MTPRRIGWLVSAVGRRLPGVGTCLTQALLVQAVLEQSGRESKLRIGVSRAEGDRFRAHAWVECGAEVVVGGAAQGQYQPIVSLE